MGTVRWEIDDRPPTLWTRAYVQRMWANRDEHAFEGAEHTLATARALQAQGDAPPTRLTRALRQVETATTSGMTTWSVRPRRTPPARRVLYLHGGGYIHPLTPDYWRLARALSSAPVEVVLPAYPLAPDHTVDEVLPQLVDLVDKQRSRDDLPLVLMGDSAGGALVLVLASRLRDLGRPLPELVIGLSPWLDATLSEDEITDLDPTDPMLAVSGLRAAGCWWAGERTPSDPLVSPLQGELDGLCPVEIFIGDRDILRPAVDRLADQVREGVLDVDLGIHEVTAMFHVWMTRALPEAVRTRRALTALLAARDPGTGRARG